MLKRWIVDEIELLRKSGLSYKEISSKLGISKATVYNYGNAVKLNKNASQKIANKIKANQKRFINKYAKLKELPRKVEWNTNKARLISHCIFDGSVTDISVNYTSSSKKLIKEFIEDMLNVYKLDYTNVYVKKGKNFNKYTVTYCSKELCKDLKRYTKSYNSISELTRVPNGVFMSSKNLISEFLRAFWEDEGCITIDGEMLARIKNRGLRDQLIDLHRKMNIACSAYDCSDGAYGIRIIRNSKNLNRFKLISFKDAIITRGINKGELKKDLLERIYNKSY